MFFSLENLIIFTYFAIVAVFLFLLFFLYLFVAKNYYYRSIFSTIVLKITLPKFNQEKNNEEKWKETLNSAESLYAAIGGLKANTILDIFFRTHKKFISFEIIAQNETINYYLALPKDLKRFLIQQIHAQYPHAFIEEVDDYNIFKANSNVAGGFFVFKKNFAFPIKTYQQMENDPINSILNSLSKLKKDEGVAIQLLMIPINNSWRQSGKNLVKKLMRHESINSYNNTGIVGKIISYFFDLLFNGFKTNKKKEDKSPITAQLTAQEQKTIESIEQKLAKGALGVNLRVIVSTQNKDTTNAYLNDILHAFSQYNIYEYGNSFQPAFLTWHSKLIRNFIYRRFDNKRKIILNTEELASIYHFPSKQNDIPNLQWLESKKYAPPLNLPLEGLTIGQNQYRGENIEVKIKTDDRRRHMYIIGQTGTGKSTMMKNMMIQDIIAGNGCCIIDPHGDFAVDILRNIPRNRWQDVIYFDPSDTERPISINMLEYNTDSQKSLVVNELLAIFDKLYDLKATGGPMFEQYMRNALLLVMDDPDSGMTLLEIPRVLADENYRKYKLSKCKNPTVIDFWQKEALQAGGEAALANMVPYITSKLTPFIANDLMRPIIASQKSSFDFRKIMDEKKILVVNLSKGKLGEINSRLLGMIIVGKILIAALSRADITENIRTDFYLYIDEFQNFTTDSIAIILAEARKYRLNLILANQYIGQLTKHGDTSIRDAVFGNVGTFIAFRIGPEDAEYVVKQFEPIFNQHDLINIPKFNAYIKMIIDNTTVPAFNINTLREPIGDDVTRGKVIALSKLHYGKPKKIIESKILDTNIDTKIKNN